MFKKLGSIFVFFFLGFHFASAGVVINEIMYMPVDGGGEWIEIFNSGSNSVDLDGWRFFNNSEDSAPLRLQKGSAVLSSGGYATITTTSDWSSFYGTVFSSSQFSLPNDSSKYNTYKAISDSEKQIIDFITYDTNLGGKSGDSLSRINNSWISGVPTPGSKNSSSASDSSSGEEDGVVESSSVVTQITSETKTKKVEIPKIKTEILGKTFGFVGIPLSLEAISFGLEGEQLPYGKYFWNFGDGDSRETKTGENQKFSHTYFYPGDYVVSLDFYSSFYSMSPDASNKINIKIVPANISISRVGQEGDFFVELSNDTAYDLELSNWILASGEKSFVLPRNTILEAEGKIILSPRITLFSIADKNNLKLMTPGREIVFVYAPVTESKIAPVVVSSTPSSILPLGKGERPKAEGAYFETEIPAKNLSASVISGNAVQNSSTSKSSTIIVSLIFLVFLGVSASAVYFIRQSRRVPQAGDDFAILDE